MVFAGAIDGVGGGGGGRRGGGVRRRASVGVGLELRDATVGVGQLLTQ